MKDKQQDYECECSNQCHQWTDLWCCWHTDTIFNSDPFTV